jgi:MmyB-like transcription regulator ligand binding domain
MDGMSSVPVPGELGAFLKARRAQLSPRDFGLPETGTRRKVTGLRRRTAQRVRPAMRRLLDQLAQTPAVVLGRRMDILAWNAMAAALYTDFGAVPAARRNYLRLLFTDPLVRGLHAEWEHTAG